MVKRCGFYTDGTNIICKPVTIEWDLGFDRQAKQEYIKRIMNELPESLSPKVDITSASPNPLHRSLSPIYIQYGKGSLEDFLQSNPSIVVPGVVEFIYISNLSTTQKSIIKETNCFIDVFHNPNKGKCTQAAWCAYAKLLMLKDKEDLLRDMDAFLNWYNDVGFFTIGG